MKNKPIVPIPGRLYKFKIRHYKHGDIVEIDLICSYDEDCTWRTVDDNSELNAMDWDVIEAIELNRIAEK